MHVLNLLSSDADFSRELASMLATVAVTIEEAPPQQQQQPKRARQRGLWFILGSFIASNIHAALFLSNCDILGVKIIRIDPLELNLWLYYVYYAVLQLLF